MARIRVQLKTLSPVAFGARRGTTSSFVDTLDYVPGTALRGAAASRYLREMGSASDERFREIFLSGGVLFANLYPIRDADISHVLPATARSCKAHPGFLYEDDPASDDEKHGVGDILVRAAAFQRIGDCASLDEAAVCQRCRQPTDRFAGFYEQPPGEAVGYSKVEVYKRHLTHVGINRRTQTAERGFLYAQQVINEAKRERDDRDFRAQLFSGELIVKDQQAGFVKDTLLAEEVILLIGESRSRGLGRMQVVGCQSIESDTEETVKRRITEFNQTPFLRERGYIAITLQSDAILTDAFMRPKSALEADDLHRILKDDDGSSPIAPGTLRLVYTNAGARLVQSWNVASGYPKPDDIAITMGSVFLFELTEGEAKDLAAPLALLQERGVGKRRSEGFGRLTVCDAFHWEVQELWQAI